MQTIATAFLDATHSGERIDIPFPQIQSMVDFRTGELAMLAGAPGGGKTLWAVNFAMLSTDPIIYFSMEAPHSVKARMAALALNQPTYDIKDEDPDYLYTRLTAQDKRHSLIQVPRPQEVKNIAEYIEAFKEWWGGPPKVVILDNIKDMTVEGFHHQETGYWANLLPELKQLAQEESVGIIGLHHVSRGESDDGTEPLSMTDLLHSGERDARHVWGVYRNDFGPRIHFQVLKQTDGEVHAEGSYVRLDWNPSYGRLMSR